MGIEYKKNTAHLSDLVGVEDAEGLLQWLQAHPEGKLDLSTCTHLNAANLQVLMAAKPVIVAWPSDESLANWLRNTALS